MKTYIDLGPYVLTRTRYESVRGAQGRLYITVEPITAEEFSRQEYPAMAPTIAELQQRLDRSQGQLYHPINEEPFAFDITPWADLARDTHLSLHMGFQFDPGQGYTLPPELQGLPSFEP